MPQRSPITHTAAAAALALASLCACHPKSLAQGEHDAVRGGGVHVQTSEALSQPVTVADKLNCPQTEGALARTSQSPDGRACAYSSDKGVVELALMPGAAADPSAALAPLKSRIDAMLPREANGGTVAVTSETGADGKEHSKVDMPFIHVRDDGRRSHVRVFGMTIDADDDKNKTESSTSAPGGTESVYVLAGGTPSADGYHAAGYVARGGRTGALLVGTFKYRNGDDLNVQSGRHEPDANNDLDRLMDLNAPKG